MRRVGAAVVVDRNRRTPAARWNAAHSRMCRASLRTISAMATPSRPGSGSGGTMPILLILPRAGSFQNMLAILSIGPRRDSPST